MVTRDMFRCAETAFLRLKNESSKQVSFGLELARLLNWWIGLVFARESTSSIGGLGTDAFGQSIGYDMLWKVELTHQDIDVWRI